MAGNKLTAGTNNLLAVIGDEETVVGMLLAGVGNVDGRKSSNFFVVDDASACVRTRARRGESARLTRPASRTTPSASLVRRSATFLTTSKLEKGIEVGCEV